MRPNQHNSFSSSHGGGNARYGASRQNMTHAQQQLEVPGAALIWLIRKLALLFEKLLVVAKYQFYKRTAVAPSRIQTPVVKLCVVGFLAFIVFKRDFSVSVGSGQEMTKFGGIAEEAAFHADPGNGGGGKKQGVWAQFASIFEEEDPFLDKPSDDESDRRVKAYIRKYKDVAIAEKEKYGIPASIKMAQALVESNAGASSLSTKNNNHFGIKCFSRTCKKGHCSNFGDDSHKDFFRKYPNDWESFRAHSQLIVNGKYKSLLKHGDDYRKWAAGLKKLGYATAQHYEKTLLGKIEKYKLYKLDE